MQVRLGSVADGSFAGAHLTPPAAVDVIPGVARTRLRPCSVAVGCGELEGKLEQDPWLLSSLRNDCVKCAAAAATVWVLFVTIGAIWAGYGHRLQGFLDGEYLSVD